MELTIKEAVDRADFLIDNVMEEVKDHIWASVSDVPADELWDVIQTLQMGGFTMNLATGRNRKQKEKIDSYLNPIIEHNNVVEQSRSSDVVPSPADPVGRFKVLHAIENRFFRENDNVTQE